MSMITVHVTADAIGEVHTWPTDEAGPMFRVEITNDHRGSIAGKIDAAVALRDALNVAIEQAAVLGGGAK